MLDICKYTISKFMLVHLYLCMFVAYSQYHDPVKYQCSFNTLLLTSMWKNDTRTHRSQHRNHVVFYCCLLLGSPRFTNMWREWLDRWLIEKPKIRTKLPCLQKKNIDCVDPRLWVGAPSRVGAFILIFYQGGGLPTFDQNQGIELNCILEDACGITYIPFWFSLPRSKHY